MNIVSEDETVTIAVSDEQRESLLSLLEAIAGASERNDEPYTEQLQGLVNDLQTNGEITFDDLEFARYLQDQVELSTSPRLSDPVAQQLVGELAQVIPVLEQDR